MKFKRVQELHHLKIVYLHNAIFVDFIFIGSITAELPLRFYHCFCLVHKVEIDAVF